MKSKSLWCFADIVDTVHAAFRYSGFAIKGLFKSKTEIPSCESTHYLGGTWIGAPVTIEQLRVEDYLDHVPLQNKVILHVGIGSSSLARKVHDRVRMVEGVTVMESERQYAQGLNIPNYRVFLMDKYSGQLATLSNKYHYIIDTNLSSFAAKREQFDLMMQNYIALLENGGMLLTDRFGMHFHEPYAFGISEEDLIDIEKKFPVKYRKITPRSVRALVKCESY